jgi:rubrerythrin
MQDHKKRSANMYPQQYAYYGWIPVRVAPAEGAGGEAPCLQKALPLIKEAVQGEREDELFYQHLISLAPSKEEKGIIASIRDDERKHNRMFRQIYKDLTGKEIQAPEKTPFERPSSYLDGIRTALFGELKAVENYRRIRQCLPAGGPYRDMLFEIITDELRHASKYNYLFALNRK